MTKTTSLLVAGMTVGCSTDGLESEWELTLEQMEGRALVVADSLPPRDAVGVGREMAPYVLFSRPLGPTESTTLELVDPQAEVVVTAPRRDPDELGVAFDPGLLASSTAYSGDMQLLGAPSTRFDYSTTPPTGPAFNMSTGLEVEAFGAGGNLALVNELFQPGVFPLWVLHVDGLGSPPSAAAPATLRIAPGRVDDASPIYVLHAEWGFVSVFDEVVVTEGSFAVDKPTLFLPLWSSDAVHLLHMTDVALTGALAVDGETVSVSQITLTGVLGTRSLIDLARASEGWRLAIGNTRPDVDTNGNGTPDAVTFTFSTTPSAIDVAEIDY